jgi:nicotinate-nucleotide adenylyltransferase
VTGSDVTTPCVAVLGGSFDPVHNGHVALAQYVIRQLEPHTLRIIPAGNPWQKSGLHASAAHRIAMVRLAFASVTTPVVIDEQEIHRQAATYTIDTLRAVRAELGSAAAIVFVIGADQLQKLHTWRQWEALFDYASLFAVSRPGYAMNGSDLDPAVAEQFARRSATVQQLRSTPCGLSALSTELDIHISATDIRSILSQGNQINALLPLTVLDYIQQHHLYQP